LILFIQNKKLSNEASNSRIINEKQLFLNETPNIYKDKDVQNANAEKNKLYCDLLYTTKYKIGRTIDGHSDYINDLYVYAKQAFNMQQDEHEHFFSMINDEKPPIIVLLIEIKEACNLSIKDANGFSDPYCMLGILNKSN
jgi:hypothetical protein